MSSLWKSLSDVAEAHNAAYQAMSFSDKAKVYVDHYELKTHFWPNASCPWCCAQRALQSHEPDHLARPEIELIDLSNE